MHFSPFYLIWKRGTVLPSIQKRAALHVYLQDSDAMIACLIFSCYMFLLIKGKQSSLLWSFKVPKRKITTRGCRSPLSHENIRSELCVCVEEEVEGMFGTAYRLSDYVQGATPHSSPCSYGNSSMATSTSLLCPHPPLTSQRCWVCAAVTDKWYAARWRLRDS